MTKKHLKLDQQSGIYFDFSRYSASSESLQSNYSDDRVVNCVNCCVNSKVFDPSDLGDLEAGIRKVYDSRGIVLYTLQNAGSCTVYDKVLNCKLSTLDDLAYNKDMFFIIEQGNVEELLDKHEGYMNNIFSSPSSASCQGYNLNGAEFLSDSVLTLMKSHPGLDFQAMKALMYNNCCGDLSHLISTEGFDVINYLNSREERVTYFMDEQIRIKKSKELYFNVPTYLDRVKITATLCYKFRPNIHGMGEYCPYSIGMYLKYDHSQKHLIDYKLERVGNVTRFTAEVSGEYIRANGGRFVIFVTSGFNHYREEYTPCSEIMSFHIALSIEDISENPEFNKIFYDQINKLNHVRTIKPEKRLL